MTVSPGSLPVDVSRVVSRNRLGRLEHTFLPRKEVNVPDRHRGLFIAGSLAGIAALAAGGLLLCVFVQWTIGLYPLFIAVLLLAALLKSPNVRKKVGSRRLYLFEEGLLVDQGKGQLFAVRWDQAVHYQATVQEVIRYKGTTTPVSSGHVSILRAPDGVTVKISDAFADHITWAPLISEAIARAQVQQVWEAIRTGQRVAFGPFELDAAAVTAGRKGTLPWSEVAAVEVREGVVFVRQRGRSAAWARAAVKDVPNVLLMLTIARNLYGE